MRSDITSNLQRLIWRHKARIVLKEKVRDRIQNVMNQLWEQYRVIYQDAGGLLQQGDIFQNMLRLFENNMNKSNELMHEEEYSMCLSNIKDAEELIEEMKIAQEAYNSMIEANRATDVIHQYGGEEWSAVKECKFILLKAQDHLAAGRYRAARFLSIVCIDDVKRLTECRELTSEEQKDLEKRFSYQQQLFNFMKEYPEMDQIRTYTSSALKRVSRALQDKHPVSAESLLTDVEVATDGLTFFCSALHSRNAQFAQIDYDNPIRPVAQTSGRIGVKWHETVEGLLGRTITRIAGELSMIEERIAEDVDNHSI
ncbi:MAG: hypothetical protein ACLQDF_01990 [Desulfomonilia bacterium]